MSNVVSLRTQKMFDLFSSVYYNLLNFLLSCSQEIQKIIIHAVNTDQNLASMAQSPIPFLFFLSKDSSANDIDANSAGMSSSSYYHKLNILYF